MRASYWWCALLMLGGTHLAYAEEPASAEAPSMEVIEMLGGMDDQMVDLEIAMSKMKIEAEPATQDMKDDEKPAARKMDTEDKPAAQEVKNAK